MPQDSPSYIPGSTNIPHISHNNFLPSSPNLPTSPPSGLSDNHFERESLDCQQNTTSLNKDLIRDQPTFHNQENKVHYTRVNARRDNANGGIPKVPSRDNIPSPPPPPPLSNGIRCHSTECDPTKPIADSKDQGNGMNPATGDNETLVNDDVRPPTPPTRTHSKAKKIGLGVNCSPPPHSPF